MKKTLLLALSGLFSIYTRGQEQASGIINDYAAVLSIDYCANSLEVSDPTGFGIGDALILIQMQGATIDISNSASYGSVTNLGKAGLYERAFIAAISGSVITLENTLLHEYDTDGAVQAVRMPIYSSGLTITDTLTARAWDGSTGGVLAFEAPSVTLQGPVDVSGKGFRGGPAALNYTGDCNFLDNFSNFAYDESSIRAGRKGEGISAIDSSRARGRGAQANGGGGGNDHNAGGGGGGNISPGGLGGENANPSTFGCRGRNPGQGGKALIGVPAGRIFMGGGGGAGHGNNDVATDGGDGGGIIIMRAGEIINSGFPVKASGLASTASRGDGAGGGGGAGAIALILDNGDGSNLLLEARGGNGGNADNANTGQCFGPGGGGGGGWILRSGAAMASLFLAGGQPGMSINSSACGTSANGALSGSAGAVQSFSAFPESTEIFIPFQLIAQGGDTSSCAGQAITLPVTLQGSGLTLQWQVDEGNGFEDLQSGLIYGATDVPGLLINSVSNGLDGNRYRLLISNDCIDSVYTVPVTLGITPAPQAAFNFSTNGLQVSFSNSSSNADSYLWDFGDGNTSTDLNPVHTYASSGNYEASLTVANACGSNTVSTEITFQQAPAAAFQPMPAAGCTPLSVLFSNTSTGDGNSYQWLFPGGAPTSSTDGAPIVSYDNPGGFDVTLIATNAAGSDTLTIAGAVQVGAAPTADFGLARDNLTITLTNLSTNADTYLWDFGDGNTSTAPNPVHTYGSAGDYEVSLTATNACGSKVFVLPASVAQRPTPLFSTENPLSGCPPHTVYFIDESTGDYDSLRWDFPGGDPATTDIPNPEVTYNTPGQYSVQLTLFWLDGEETLSQAQSIEVLEGPSAGFTYILDGFTATFTNLSANATEYSWDFGDGTGSSNAENPEYTFTVSGAYQVTLLASNGACSDTTTAEITILRAPETAFQPMPAAGCAPLSVLFGNTSTGDGNSYQWFFPGGSPASSTDGAPIVSYNNPGAFDVTLIATNGAGSDTLAIAGAVQVGAAPMAGFTISSNGLSVILNNLSSGADSYFWDFGDGNSSTLANPTHTYANSGDYEISLTVTNACGTDVLARPITVARQPVPLYSTENPLTGCLPHTVYFVNQSGGDYDSLRWSFPGGMPATTDIPNPEVLYEAVGQYTVQLTLYWQGGEETLIQPQAVTVVERPRPAFTFELNGLTATFTNLSTNANRYTWIFGDGTTSNEENPVHTFPGPGNFDVTLNASFNGNCTRASGQSVYIKPSGIEEYALPEGVKVFPNPTSGELWLQSERVGWYPVQWRLFNLQGGLMASGTAAQDELWRLEQWPAGAYLLQLFNAEELWMVRVVKY